MAINLITAPTSTGPSVFASPVINQLASLLDCINMGAVVQDGYILEGAMFCIGGAMYLADSDTAISGTESNYVAVTASGSTATAAYVSSLSDVSYDAAYHGYFDTGGVLYLFDESDAINDGYITTDYALPTPTRLPRHFTAGTIAFNSLDSTYTIDEGDSDYGEVAYMYCPRAGIITTSFAMHGSVSTSTIYAQIYVDGVAVGTVHTLSSTTATTFTDSVEVSAGSRVSIYAYISDDVDTYYGYFTEFKLESGIIL